MLRKNSAYKDLYLYQWLKEDIKSFYMEQITEKINDLFVSWGFDSSEVGPIMTLVLIIGIAFLADLICRNILLRVVAKLVKRPKQPGMILCSTVKF